MILIKNKAIKNYLILLLTRFIKLECCKTFITEFVIRNMNFCVFSSFKLNLPIYVLIKFEKKNGKSHIEVNYEKVKGKFVNVNLT